MRLAAKKSLYLITDRRLLGTGPQALDRVVQLAADAAVAGIDFVQLRERDLDTRSMVALAERVRERVAGRATRVLVSDRFDVALAARIDGVHLATHSIEPGRVRRVVGAALLIGVSTHSSVELECAYMGGADFAVCGPMFDTPSKRAYGSPIGPGVVADLAAKFPIPVLGIGGVTLENALEAARSPVAGLAAIGMFHSAWLAGGLVALTSLVADLHATICYP